MTRAVATIVFKHFCRVPEERLTRVKGQVLSMGRLLLGLPPLAQRSHLPTLLRLLRLRGAGVEVGVAEGAYSELVLRDSELATLYSVDPWTLFDPRVYHDRSNASAQRYEQQYHATAARLRRFGARSQLLRMTSEEAAQRFDAETVEFVYIDANHAYHACRRDLELWWPKLKRGGVFAGHDYLNGELPQGSFGVKRAVDEFVSATGQRLFVTPESPWPTWYLVKDCPDPIFYLNRRLTHTLFEPPCFWRMGTPHASK